MFSETETTTGIDGKKSARERRGQVSREEILSYHNFGSDELMTFLSASDSRLRSIAAYWLGKRRLIAAVNPLCDILRHDKSLYPRIAASEALSRIGEPAVKPLCLLLGLVGDNHETDLPLKCCDKKGFPLVRDLAGRTLVKIGEPAVPSLIDCLMIGPIRQIKEAVDVLGAIAAQTGLLTALPVLLQTMSTYQCDDFLLWKFTRSLGGFPQADAAKKLLPILNRHVKPALRWEAARSLGQIGIANSEIIAALTLASHDRHPEVRRAVTVALKRLAGVGDS